MIYLNDLYALVPSCTVGSGAETADDVNLICFLLVTSYCSYICNGEGMSRI